MAEPLDDLFAREHGHSESEIWRDILLGTKPELKKLRRMWHYVPSEPRCKVCAAPFRGIGSAITRITGHRRSNANPLMCNPCFSQLRDHPGGAEIEISVLFADIRGSTGLAERVGAARFRHLLQHFYAVADRAIDRHGGVVDKFMGDGIMALFVPFISGEHHARQAVEAGQSLVTKEAHDPHLREAGVKFGVGVHTGIAYVGTLGSGDKFDFSALGDTVNAAARLGSQAGPSELLVSWAAWQAAGLPADNLDRRVLALAGRSEPMDVVHWH
ncbi:MAG TPA: adenylate/guanylate cyclase domain-containing protein [Bauldia sp.]|nr:adenylate/guanylate cyclase domain-containing protein [Bauldia sp.]